MADGGDPTRQRTGRCGERSVAGHRCSRDEDVAGDAGHGGRSLVSVKVRRDRGSNDAPITRARSCYESAAGALLFPLQCDRGNGSPIMRARSYYMSVPGALLLRGEGTGMVVH